MAGPVRVLVDFHSERYPLWNFPAPLFASLVEAFPTVMFHACISEADFRTHLPSATIIFGRWLRPEDLPLAEQLVWFHTAAAGVERQLYPAFLEREIVLTTSAGARSGAMAEGMLGAIIAFNRQFPRLWEAQRRQDWIAPEIWLRHQEMLTLDGRLMVIAGLGSIGQEVARLAKAFGMEVWGTKRDLNADCPWVDRVAPPGALGELLAGQPLVVVNALPDNASTRQLFGAVQFEQMGPQALFVNVGRGATVDEAALIYALASQTIRGAILDVFVTEPLPEDSPLWQQENCWVLPHITNIVDRFWDPTTAIFEENLRRYLFGQALLNEVDQSLERLAQ